MSINVYLKDDVQKLEGFTVTPKQHKNEKWNEYEIADIKLWRDKGRWYTILHEPTETIPAVIADIVEDISLHEWMPMVSHREAGIYRYNSAEAEIEPDKISGETRLRICIRAKKMEDILELYRRIKCGSIRPEQSYEGEQKGMSMARTNIAMEQENAALKKSLHIIEGMRMDDKRIIRDKLRQFCDEMKMKRFFLVYKSMVIEKIDEIIKQI